MIEAEVYINPALKGATKVVSVRSRGGTFHELITSDGELIPEHLVKRFPYRDPRAKS